LVVQFGVAAVKQSLVPKTDLCYSDDQWARLNEANCKDIG